jgi:hypothetical protein
MTIQVGVGFIAQERIFREVDSGFVVGAGLFGLSLLLADPRQHHVGPGQQGFVSGVSPQHRRCAGLGFG